MRAAFEKWHGCGNDFIVIHIRHNQKTLLLPSLRRMAETLCSRDGTGIGADGILVLCPDSDPAAQRHELIIINQDGSLARNCGNGLRCVLGSFSRQQEGSSFNREQGFLELRVGPLIFYGERYSWSPCLQKGLFGVTMPPPLLDQQCSWYEGINHFARLLLSQRRFSELQPEEWHCCETGNPHFVIFTHAPVNSGLLQQLGGEFLNFRELDGVNLHLATEASLNRPLIAGLEKKLGGTVGGQYAVRAWERGVGETKACGSGACAVGISVLKNAFECRENWILIAMPGGPLLVRQRDENGPVLLAGEAAFVFQGELEL